MALRVDLWERYTEERKKHKEQAEDFEKNGRIPLSAQELNFLAFALRETIAGVIGDGLASENEKAKRRYEDVAVGETMLRILAAVDVVNLGDSGQMFELRRIDV